MQGSLEAVLAAPTESEVEELYEAVDFDPDEVSPDIADTTKWQFSINCLVPETRISFCDTIRSSSQDTTRSVDELARIELHSIAVESHLSQAATTAELSIREILLIDCACEGPGVEQTILRRAQLVTSSTSLPSGEPQAAFSETQDDGENTPTDDTQQPKRLPAMLKLKLSTVGASSAAQVAPTLDVLVQPIYMYYKPACLMRLARFVPAALPNSFAAREMAALNALTETAIALIKVERLLQLGPGLDIALKVLDIEIGVESNAAHQITIRDGCFVSASLHTGPITVQTIADTPSRQAVNSALRTIAQEVNKQRAGIILGQDATHILSSSSPSLRKLARQLGAATGAPQNALTKTPVEQSSLGTQEPPQQHDTAEDDQPKEGEEPSSTNESVTQQATPQQQQANESEDQYNPSAFLSAVKTLQEHLGYQRLQINVSCLHIVGIQNDSETPAKIEVLQSTKLGVTLSIQRLIWDISSTQVYCSLAADPIVADIAAGFIKLVSACSYTTDSHDDDDGISSSSSTSSGSQAGSDMPKLEPSIVVDVRLKALDLGIGVPSPHHISLRDGFISLSVFDGRGVAAKVHIMNGNKWFLSIY